MLAKILQEMWVEPEVLEALSEEQKRILFIKMREEQVRRWRERDEEEDDHVGPGKASRKHVTWLLGRDGDVRVSVIGEEDEFRSSKLLQSLLNNSKWKQHNGNTPQTPTSRSVEEEMESGSAGEEPRDASSESDCESGGSGDNLHRGWAPLHQTQLCNHGNRPPLREQSLDADRTLPLDRVAMGGPEEKPVFGKRVAQLKGAFAPGTTVSSKPPIPVKPPHLQTLNRSVPQGPKGLAAS
ncbi:SH2 domain-containing protein 4B [Merluccius polli]|uniref:SH2 domain-containing protein 4B n=1 Tax=Merluccius polli TaxID=89951 RepID=A0AA47M184_MERPO|nr:SH2 domain-containing protein 4B [Merluccius polli]